MTNIYPASVKIKPGIGKPHYTGETSQALNDLIVVVENSAAKPFSISPKSKFYMGYGRLIYRVAGKRLDDVPVIKAESEAAAQDVYNALYGIVGIIAENSYKNFETS